MNVAAELDGNLSSGVHGLSALHPSSLIQTRQS
jgi:hypothetical protein